MGNTTNRQPVDWLRVALQNVLEAAPVQGYAKKQANTLVQQMPEWLLLRWSEANGINSAAGCHSVPQLPEMFLTDMGRTQVEQYVETHRCVPLARSLRRIVSAVTKLDAEGRLPCSYSEVVYATAAVAMGNRTVEGKQCGLKRSAPNAGLRVRGVG